jgi:hypothetical protein
MPIALKVALYMKYFVIQIVKRELLSINNTNVQNCTRDLKYETALMLKVGVLLELPGE